MPGPFLNQRPQDVVSRQRFKSRLEKDFKKIVVMPFRSRKKSSHAFGLKPRSSMEKQKCKSKRNSPA